MIIGVDAGALSITDERLKVGVYRVTLNLLRELTKIDQANEYRLYSFIPIDPATMRQIGGNMKNVVLTPSPAWFTVRLPLELRMHPVDVFLGLAQAIPVTDAKKIGFIYDLGFLYEPAVYGKSAKKLKTQTGDVVNRANTIVTISESSKRDILHEYHIPDKHVTVAYPGVDDRFTSKGEVYKGERPYFLFVGSLNKAKDLPRAIRAFAAFLHKSKKPYDLLLIGGDYWPDAEIDATIAAYHLADSVKKLGHVADEELPQYYRGAAAFFTTPLREGFCLPAAEAMACGTPVVSVSRGAMKEVVGGGGVVAGALDEEEIAAALYNVVMHKTTYQQKARTQAKQYTWSSFARPVYDLIKGYEHTTA